MIPLKEFSNFCHVEKTAPSQSTLAVQFKDYVVSGDAAVSWPPALGVYWSSYVFIRIYLAPDSNKHYAAYNNGGTWTTFVDVTGGSKDTWWWYRIRLTSSNGDHKSRRADACFNVNKKKRCLELFYAFLMSCHVTAELHPLHGGKVSPFESGISF